MFRFRYLDDCNEDTHPISLYHLSWLVKILPDRNQGRLTYARHLILIESYLLFIFKIVFKYCHKTELNASLQCELNTAQLHVVLQMFCSSKSE